MKFTFHSVQVKPYIKISKKSCKISALKYLLQDYFTTICSKGQVLLKIHFQKHLQILNIKAFEGIKSKNKFTANYNFLQNKLYALN